MAIEKKIMKRIKALLAMAADTSSPEEATIAAKRARYLMDEHDVTMLDANKPELVFEEYRTKAWRKAPTGYGVLALAIGKYNSALVTFEGVSLAGRGWCNRLLFRGADSDVIMCEYMFETLIKACRNQRSAWLKTIGYPSGSGAANQFDKGFYNAVGHRLHELREVRMTKAAVAGALVITTRMLAVEEHYSEKQKESNGRRSSTSYGDARWAGRAAGHRANINRPVSGSRAARKMIT